MFGAIPRLCDGPRPGVEIEVGIPFGVVGPARPPRSESGGPPMLPPPPAPGTLPNGDDPLPGERSDDGSIVGPWPRAADPASAASRTATAIKARGSPR